MINEYFKVSDTDESFLDLNEILKVELKNDNVQLFHTRWDETIIATKKQPDDDMLGHLCYRQLQLSEQLKPSLSLYIQDTVQKYEPRDYIRLNKDGGPVPLFSGMKHDLKKRRATKGRGKGSRSSSPRRNSFGKGSRKRTSPSGIRECRQGWRRTREAK